MVHIHTLTPAIILAGGGHGRHFATFLSSHAVPLWTLLPKRLCHEEPRFSRFLVEFESNLGRILADF